ncbi:MAG: hypothetical protein ED557_00130 [Balneola sp.]|nr:MAG: hypothetical protein ED557_00130 [Balneola sp.]
MISSALNKVFPAGIFVLLVMLVLTHNVDAQSVIKITEDGKELGIPNELKASLTSANGSENEILKQWYASKGFLAAKIRQLGELRFEINKGCLFQIENVMVQSEVNSKYRLEGFGSYSDTKLEEIAGQVLSDFEDEGYAFASLEIEHIDQQTGKCTLDIHLKVNAGQKYYTSEILFLGNRLNNQAYLKKISSFRDSLLITPDYLKGIQERLLGTELFEQVFYPEIVIDSSSTVLLISVQERSLNQFDGLLGYVPDQNGDGQIVGNFELSLWNVLSQGNGIDLNYQRLRPETTRLNIGVEQHWIDQIPIGLGFNFNFYQNDTTYQTRDLRLSSFYQVSNRMRLTGAIGQISSTSSSSAITNLEPDGKKQYAELGFRYSTLDNPDVPTQGNRLELSLGTSAKDIESDSSRVIAQRYVYSSFSQFIPVSRKGVVVVSTQGFFLNANTITENDLYRFGGASSFRGYEEEQFTASTLVWGELEYRFLINRSSYLFGFGAYGGYHRPRLFSEIDNSFKTTDYLSSLGFGISYKVAVGRLTFTYAISPEETIGNGKVHVGINTKL